MELGCESQGVSTLFLITVIVWCVYMVYKCGWAFLPVCKCGGPEAEKAYSITSPTHLFRQIPQWLGCINPIRLTGQWAPRILLYLSYPQWGGYRCLPHTQFLNECWGSELRPSQLHSRQFTHWAIYPVLLLTFFLNIFFWSWVKFFPPMVKYYLI